MLNLQELKRRLTRPQDQDFFIRVWSTSNEVYEKRLNAIGFANLDYVLDAGSGMGQWAVALARLNQNVIGVDFCKERVALATIIANQLKIQKLTFLQGTIEKLPFDNNSFDGIFSYSVIYLTDFRVSLRELFRVLKPGGMLYFSTNGLGWYIYNLIEGHNSSKYFSSRQMAIDTIENSISYYSQGKHKQGSSIIMPKQVVIDELRNIGYEIIQVGGDGTFSLEGNTSISFYEPEKYNLENVWEVLCKK